MFEVYISTRQIGIQIFRWSVEKASSIASINFYSRLHSIRMGYSLCPQQLQTDLVFVCNFIENCSLEVFKTKRY